MRLIDADALLQKIKAKIKSGEYLEFSSVTHTLWDINDAPIVKAEPIKHGRWKTRVSTPCSARCSLCGYTSLEDSHYCGGCGARMDLKEGD